MRIWIPTFGKDYKTNEYYKIFSKYLKNWIKSDGIEEADNGIIIKKYKHLSEFMTFTENDEQLKEIIEFFKAECIDEIILIKKEVPEIFKSQKNSEFESDI